MNMKKKLTMWAIGGIITASAMGLGFNATVGSAAENEAVKPAMHENMVMQGENKMDAKDATAMNEMMKNGDMEKHCMDMMKSPEMQSMMKEMMKTPEMQSMMKEVMQENK